MAKRRTDEGSNSDSSTGSLQEISADDFKRQDARGSSRSRVWMNDLMRYPVTRNFNQDLYSFAWAQAVQNKPLGFDVKPMKEEDDDDDDEIEMYVEDENDNEKEKEEGELEEGEIELGSEPVNLETEEEEVEEIVESEEKVEEIGEFDMRVGVILEELETITEEKAESSFEEVCSRLLKCFASLKQMFSEPEVLVLDVLVQQAFMSIQTVYSAYRSGNLKKMDQNKELLLRLLIHIKNQYSVFLTPEQVKEIDVKVHALASEAVSVGKVTSNMDGPANVANRLLISLERSKLDPYGINSIGSNSGKPGLPMQQIPTPTSRSRVDFSPLLNLHADYDEDSLPSPTRDNAPPLPILKPIGFGTGAVAPAQPMATKNVQAESGTFHPYIKDAFKAVSSYQQKYGKSSVNVSNQLPSPTPSEDANDNNDDTHGEVSSAQSTVNGRTVGPSSVVANTNSSTTSQSAPVRTFAPNPVVKSAAKSRDPRLRFMNSEVGGAPQNGLAVGAINPRKHKAIEEPSSEDNNSKRQRNGLASSRDVPMAAGRGGWIEDNAMVASHTMSRAQLNGNTIAGNRNNNSGEVNPDCRFNVNSNLNGSSAPNTSTSNVPSVSLPSLLKDIVVNPTMLMELVMKEQQRIAAAESQKQAAGPAGGVLPNAANHAPIKKPEPVKNSAAKPQIPSQSIPTNTQNDVGKIRMKPRDPRRILHTNMVQKSEGLGTETIKASGTIQSDIQNSKDRLTVADQGEQAQQAAVPSQSAPQPDISRQFTKNLKNVANFMSTSQANPPLPPGYQNISQPIPSKTANDWAEPKTVAGASNQAGSTIGGPQSLSSWGDVDHLLDGYDDHEKAAIQKERARRIAEQNKMFAARKLCLVLDLDHTLLNSAKFIEVDPIHEEVLRKKEEQDREKPERHLYRFQHMGMWTKLRPGIWNFLEKASKLFELHLYTMGNKLYATEMAKVLDPSGALFAGRVISKGDEGEPFDGDERVPKSKDLEGVLGMESAVVIIDDSIRVWPHNKLNLIVVERYTYFPCSRRQFGLLGPSLLEIDHDERPEEGTLASALGVIERIHQNFFSHQSLNEIDVRNILASEQRKILGGCKIVFSRVFPVGEASPHLHPLWQTAEQFGAECTNQIDEHVTHVVANSLGTDKVNWAISTGRFVVHPGWVEASALLYRRANEQDFVVKL